MKHALVVTTLASVVIAWSPALAARNLIINGSFETGDFTGFRLINPAADTPATVLKYNNAAGYGQGGGAFGEAITVDNSLSNSSDAAGQRAAYFVSDISNDEALTQLTALHAGNYDIGFSAYLPFNGIANRNDATFDAKIIGVGVTHFDASTAAVDHGAGVWVNYNGVASVVANGYYQTSFSFSAFGLPAKDVVIDRVYVSRTTRAATFAMSPTPTAPLPEPATWGMMIAGFTVVGLASRRRRAAVAA